MELNLTWAYRVVSRIIIIYKTRLSKNYLMAKQLINYIVQYTDPLGSVHNARVSKNEWASPIHSAQLCCAGQA